jgi:inhibitor of KinA sporulation pathway (predicted exonuclease)
MSWTPKSILVVDVEALCWHNDDRENWPPVLYKEIIEIGAVVYDVKTGGVSQQLSILVKPRFGKVSKFCTELTGWTQEDVDSGLDIQEALDLCRKEFKMDDQTIWASYGEYDRKMLGTAGRQGDLRSLYNTADKSISSPFQAARTHINVKTLFALKNKLNKEIGLDGALKYLGKPFQGRHHNGGDDALNIATVLRSCLN